jgi:hypothetical protein
MRALPANGKIAAVPQSAIALNFDQPADVHLDLLAEISFDAAFDFDRLAKTIDFFFGQILDLLRVFHVRLGAQRERARLSNSIDRRQADPNAFLRR